MILTHGANSIGGGNYPVDLITLFYGDYVLSNNNYKYRFFNPDYISSISEGLKAKNISDSVYDVTPIGDIPIFVYKNCASGYWNLTALFNDGVYAFPFTVDFWIKYENGNPWGERTQVCEVDYRLNGDFHWFIVGPYSSLGFYYNGGSGGMNINCGMNVAFDNSWHHMEFDVDTSAHTMKFYFDGNFIREITLSQYVANLTSNDTFVDTYVLNDSGNHREVKVTQIAVWKKIMNGACYSMGLYHDGNKFLI